MAGMSLTEKGPQQEGTSQRKSRLGDQPANRQAYTHKKPVAYSFNGERHSVGTFKEVLLGLCASLYRIHKNQFDRVLDLRGRTKAYFSRHRRGMTEGRKIEGTAIFAETNLSSNGVMERCGEVLELLGHSREELQVELREP